MLLEILQNSKKNTSARVSLLIKLQVSGNFINNYHSYGFYITNLWHFIVESTPCKPNPCNHNGKCKVEMDNFECDCTGTFYHEKTCERGILIVPKIPLLVINQIINNLEIQEHSEQSLIITLISSPNIMIEAKIINLTKNKTSAMFTLTTKRYGSFFIKYEITDKNEADFYNPDHSFGFADEINKTLMTPICYQCGGTLIKDCFIQIVKNVALLPYLSWSSSKVKGVLHK